MKCPKCGSKMNMPPHVQFPIPDAAVVRIAVCSECGYEEKVKE